MSLADPEPPKRYSADDPDWRPSVARCIDILLNGTMQSNVTAYDCEAGTVTMYMLSAAGKFVLVPEGDALIEHTITGDVSVRWNANRPRFEPVMAMFRRMLTSAS